MKQKSLHVLNFILHYGKKANENKPTRLSICIEASKLTGLWFKTWFNEIGESSFQKKKLNK